jgi:hypothetical protein
MHGVSVTPEKTTQSLVGGTTRGTNGDIIAIPATVAWASIAVAIGAVLNVFRSMTFGGDTTALANTLIKNNAKAKKPKSPYGMEQALHDLDKLKHNGIVQALIMGAALIVLAVLLRGGRMAHNARWLVVLILIFTGAPMAITSLTSDLRPIYNVLSVLVSITAIAAIALIFVAPSRAFFAATKAATGRPGLFGPKTGAPAGGAQGPRPGGLLGGLFGPPRDSSPTAKVSTGSDDDNPSAGRSTAKVRAASNDAAVAKGADLARERAKASKAKSRRTS